MASPLTEKERRPPAHVRPSRVPRGPPRRLGRCGAGGSLAWDGHFLFGCFFEPTGETKGASHLAVESKAGE